MKVEKALKDWAQEQILYAAGDSSNAIKLKEILQLGEDEEDAEE